LAQDFNHMYADDAQWNEIEPLLDEAMTTLEEPDRAAILLRYFEGKTFREVGAAAGVSEDAAQKRVSRALERLRAFFSGRGVTVGSMALAVLISANAVHASPAGLAAAIGGATTTLTTSKVIAMTTLQKILISATIIAATGAGIYEARQARALRGEINHLLENQAPLTAAIEKLRGERDDISNRLSLSRAQLEQFQHDRSDLARLRAEVSRLRQDTNDLAEAQASASDPAFAAAAAWKDRVTRLKARLAQTPGARIAEMQLLTDNDWLNAARDNLDTDEDYRRAFGALRNIAENTFINQLQPALQKYLAANNHQFPADLSQLQQYFPSPVDSAMLDRYTIEPASASPNAHFGGDQIIVEKTPTDPDYDVNWAIGPDGFGNNGTYSQVADQNTLMPAFKAYYADHKLSPDNLSLLEPYLTTPEQQAALQRRLASIGKN
jgi:hypothetical protein